MFVAVYNVVPRKLAADALASSILSLTFQDDKNISSIPAEDFERGYFVKQICILLHRLSMALGSSYDGFAGESSG